MDNKNTRKNLILGGGFVSSNLRELLEEKGEEVVTLSRGDGKDLRKSEDYISDFEWADRVWFLAWDIGVWKKDKDNSYEIDILESNLQLCKSVFRVLEKVKKPFLFVSSHASTEMIPLGVTKRVAEIWTKLLDGHVARLWNVYGWQPVGEKSHVIPDLVWKGLNGRVELMSDGEEKRQFLHVRDCVEAFYHQLEIGQKYADITSFEWVLLKEVARLAGDKIGVEVSLGSKPGNPGLKSPEVPLGSWGPKISLDQGLDDVINKARKWQKENH